MSDPVMSNSSGANSQSVNASEESFKDILSQFEQSHTVKRTEGIREGTVVSVSAD